MSRCLVHTATLLLCVLLTYGCNKPDDPLPPEEEQKDYDTYGIITDSSTGKGIAGVPVTDGYTFTTTDSEGRYEFTRSVKARNIYYSTPSGYKVNIGSTGLPSFYSSSFKAGKMAEINFTLTPLPSEEDEFTLIAMGDPQIEYESDRQRFVSETVPDLKSTLSDLVNPYMVVLGDIIYDANDMWAPTRNALGGIDYDGKHLTVFPVIGNHDHDGTVQQSAGDYGAVYKYISYMGPTDYSFDRGGCHFVVIDNIMATSLVASYRPNKIRWYYDEGITAEQLKWLQQDINLVQDKEQKTIFLCMHSPTVDGWFDNGSEAQIYALLTQFKYAHIIAGHSHYMQNAVFKSNRCKSGKPIYEHTTATACGQWWQSNSDLTGVPSGYQVFSIKDGTVQSWYHKGVGRSKDHQLRVYDGNQQYDGGSAGTFCWHNTKIVTGGVTYTLSSCALLKDALVAEVFPGDSYYTKVELYVDGALKGEFTKLPHKEMSNICHVAFKNKAQTSNLALNLYADHFWYFKSEVPVSELGSWEVRVTQQIPDSGKQLVYTCNTLTTDYSDF